MLMITLLNGKIMYIGINRLEEKGPVLDMLSYYESLCMITLSRRHHILINRVFLQIINN